jgi:branched-chain amino acid aminotransferase
VIVDPTDLIWMNGDFVAWEDAKVHVLTHGLHYGTGVFEGVRCYETDLNPTHPPAVFRNADHVERLRRSAELFYMEIPYSDQELRQATLELVARNGLRSCYIRPRRLSTSRSPAGSGPPTSARRACATACVR